jgi:hypothetical protein
VAAFSRHSLAAAEEPCKILTLAPKLIPEQTEAMSQCLKEYQFLTHLINHVLQFYDIFPTRNMRKLTATGFPSGKQLYDHCNTLALEKQERQHAIQTDQWGNGRERVIYREFLWFSFINMNVDDMEEDSRLGITFIAKQSNKRKAPPTLEEALARLTHVVL